MKNRMKEKTIIYQVQIKKSNSEKIDQLILLISLLECNLKNKNFYGKKIIIGLKLPLERGIEQILFHFFFL